MNTTDLTAADLVGLIQLALEDIEYAEPDDLPGALAELAEHITGARFESYEEGGWLTREAGLVIRLADKRFHLTIKEG